MSRSSSRRSASASAGRPSGSCATWASGWPTSAAGAAPTSPGSRTAGRDLRDYTFLEGWGLSTAACLLDSRDVGLPVLASGGVRHPLDVARALALGAHGVGASGTFLRTLMDEGVEALVTQLSSWLDQLAALMTMLGAATPAELTGRDLLIQGTLREFCADRGIDTAQFARRSAAGTTTTGGLR